MPGILEQLGVTPKPVAVCLQFRAAAPTQPFLVEVRDHHTKRLIIVVGLKDAAMWLKARNFRPCLGAQSVYFQEAGHG